MKNVAVICEYNPFHNGHREQIDIIKNTFGDDCRIIALMSGSVVQRGEVAVYGKYQRAEAGVKCGASLVLEIPYPQSGSCAEIFAESGVLLAGALGKIDYLVFGSECGDIELIRKTAKRLMSSEFESEMEKTSLLFPEYSYPKRQAECYFKLYGENMTVTPNDTLGIEYVTAIEKYGLDIEPFTYKRRSLYSASESRRLCREKQDVSSLIPREAMDVFSSFEAVDMYKNLGKVLLCFCQMKPREYFEGVFDLPYELAGKIKNAAMTACSFEELLDGLVSKKYTRARIKRAILYAYLGVVERVDPRPSFTNLLAADEKGLSFLSEIKKSAEVTIVTKPASYLDSADLRFRRDYELNLRADAAFCQAHESLLPLNTFLKSSPYIVSGKKTFQKN